MAAVAVSSAAMAQANASISGLVGFAHQQSPSEAKGFTNTDATFVLGMSEDLGGGTRANASIQYDATNSQFGTAPLRRNASIGLSGGFGSIALANTRSSDLITRGMVAPTNLPDGMYDSSGVITRSPIDVISFTAPAISGITPYVQYVESNSNRAVTSTSVGLKDGAPAVVSSVAQQDGNVTPNNKTVVVGANFAKGPIAAGLAYKTTSGTITTGAEKSNVELFATYDLGVARVGFGYDSRTVIGGDAGMSGGIAIPAGAATIGANYAVRGDNKVTEVVAKYDLSKRTALNASFGKQTADETASVSGNQYRVGIYHSF